MMTRYTLPELPYDYAALEPHYSARLLELHHGKHHAAYVTGANATLEKLAQARDQGDFAAINQLQKSLAFHLSGHVLHSLLWRNMSPRGGGGPCVRSTSRCSRAQVAALRWRGRRSNDKE